MKTLLNFKKIVALSMITSTIFFSTTFVAFTATNNEINDVARGFICECGCNKLLSQCADSMQCNQSEEMRAEISKKLDAGWSTEKIQKYMIKKYGEMVRSAPEKKGFDLIAWIAPFAVIGVGGILIAFVFLSWSKNKPSGGVDDENKDENSGSEKETAESKKEKEVDDEYKKKVDNELKDFDW